MIDTGHLGAPPDNTEKTFDAVPLRTHSLTLASKALASKALASKALASKALREVQVDLAHVDSITTRGRLAASVAPEATQSIAAIVASAQAARHFLDLQPPVLDEVRQALDCIVRDAYRASDVIYRIRGLFKEAPPKKEPVKINGAIRDVLELTRHQVTKNGVSVPTHFAEPSPTVQADRVQLQQVILSLIVRRAPTADGRDAGAHSAFRRRYLTLSNACPKGISNFVRCIRSLGLLGRPSTRGRPGDQKKADCNSDDQ
jgi:C4-dicarboxylate-specific signal transduction histidine kinase